MCDALEVSVSGYYAWASRPGSAAERRRQDLVAAIREVHAEVRERYGRPRMTAERNARGRACSENTVARLRTAHDIRARTPRRFVRATDSGHAHTVAGNRLDRDFTPARPNAAWSADLTYVPTREGWVDLAVVEDRFRRMIVGWSMAATMESRLVVDAPERALARRRPGVGLLAHSDRGSQYASEHYQRALTGAGIVCRMSGVGQCGDNAPVERFFGRLRCEVGIAPGAMFATREEAQAVIFEYLEVFDHRVRRHSSLGFVSPEEFERAYHQTHR